MERFFKLHLPKPQVRNILLAGLGAALAIGLLSLGSTYSKTALLMAPFGASCVLLFAAPAAPFSQPMNVVAGHLLSAAIGLAVFHFASLGIFSGAAAVGLAVAAMVALRITHPPAGATALVAGAAGSWSFMVFPVLAGSVVLVVVATVFHRIVGNTYPLK